MQKKKENFLDKIVKKNYNNELELILENKAFDENTKNILLSMLYKVETAYDDYRQVKINVMPKDEFLKMIVGIIKNKVDTIKIVKINSKEAEVLKDKQFLVDKKNKTIICYPIERNLLYCIFEIGKKDKIVKDKYYLIDKTISNLLFIGNNINNVEVIRDFNGFSWDIVEKDIESIKHNLMYQNLSILVGTEFINKWIYNNEVLIDYFDAFKIKLEELYGKKNKEEIIDFVSKISILLMMKYDKDKILKVQKNKNEIEEKILEIGDREEFIKKITKEKKEINKKIRKIDTILNDKNLLQLEYEERNSNLPLEKKIFSMRVLANMMKKEREDLVLNLNKQNELLNPQKFIKYENKLEEKYKYFRLLDIKDIEKSIEVETLEFQKLFLDCYKIKIQKARTKQELINLIYEFRYYLNLPYTNGKNITQIKSINKKIENIFSLLLNKAINEKVIIKVSNNEDLNFDILKNIFNTKIIKLESMKIEIVNEKNNLYIQVFDEETFDKKIELDSININEFAVRFNKILDLFIVK